MYGSRPPALNTRAPNGVAMTRPVDSSITPGRRRPMTHGCDHVLADTEPRDCVVGKEDRSVAPRVLQQPRRHQKPS